MREGCCFLALLCGRLNLQGCSFASAAPGVCARARTRLVAGPVSLWDSCMISKLFGEVQFLGNLRTCVYLLHGCV